MADVIMTVGDVRLEARFETLAAPKTCALLRTLLPLSAQIVHVRWSGEAVWAPMGERHLNLPPENATTYPSPGQVLLYPGGISETEILIAYGPTRFASKAGTLAGNHVLTITAGADQLRAIGERILWHGAQPLTIAIA